MHIDNKIWNAIVFLVLSLVTLIFALILYFDIIIPDAPDPYDPKPNLEWELRPIFETIDCILGSISIILSLVALLILRSSKGQAS